MIAAKQTLRQQAPTTTSIQPVLEHHVMPPCLMQDHKACKKFYHHQDGHTEYECVCSCHAAINTALGETLVEPIGKVVE